MSGLISYGRVSEGGPADFGLTFDLLDGKFDPTNPALFAFQVKAAVDAYEAYCNKHLHGASGPIGANVIVAVGHALRDAIAQHQFSGHLNDQTNLARVLQSYTGVWIQAHPIETTALGKALADSGSALASAKAAVANARATGQPRAAIAALEKDVRDIQELRGTLATRYVDAAIVGHVRTGLAQHPNRYVEQRDATGRLVYAECASSRCVNGVACRVLSNGVPLVATFEAKGGTSAIRAVRDKGKILRQDERGYAVSRAGKMVNCRMAADPVARTIRNDAGAQIIAAHDKRVHVHCAARMRDGKITYHFDTSSK